MMKNNTVKEILDVILSAKNPLIISHENPDGDTYGSSFGLKYGLELKADIACSNKIDWPFTELNIKDTIQNIEKDYDLYIFMDCADDLRCGESIKSQLKDDVKTVNIDHHPTNDCYADYNYVLATSSTCEIVFDILMENRDAISKEAANYLYIGVISDSGLYVHGYTTSHTLFTGGRLIDFGADFERISKLLFRTVNKSTALLAGKLYNNLDIVNDEIAISYLTVDDFKATGANYEDSEGLIANLTNIEKMKVCVLLKQIEKETFKASLRSINGVDIVNLALEYGGGGHKQAAGCKFTGEIETIKKQL